MGDERAVETIGRSIGVFDEMRAAVVARPAS
jgi:hypothetical protein